MNITDIGANEVETACMEIKGKMLIADEGIFAVSLYNFATEEDVLNIDPEFVAFDRETKEFKISLQPEGIEDLIAPDASADPKWYVDIYLRKKPENISYGESTGEKINKEFLGYKTLIKSATIPAYNFPTHRGMEDVDAEDRMRRHQEKILRAKHEQR